MTPAITDAEDWTVNHITHPTIAKLNARCFVS